MLFKVIDDIAKFQGMTQIASELNVSRESLYRSFSPSGNPLFTTVVKVLDAIGFTLSVQMKRAS